MKKILILFLFSIFLFQSCKKEDSFTEAITSDIIISLFEEIDSTGNTFEMKCATEKIYNCSNFGIQTNYRIDGEDINIEFEKIIIPAICQTATGPAKSRINLENLENGTYNIEIKVGNKNNTGKLVVSDHSFNIEIENLKGLQLERNSLLRIPKNTIWGLIGYHANNTENLAQSYIDSLQILGATNANLSEGDYGYFTTNTSGDIIEPISHGYWFSIPYAFKYSNDMEILKNLIKNYKINYSDSVSINLYSSEGDHFWAY